MPKMKNSAAATAELNKKHFAHKITRIVAASPGLNSRLCRGGKNLPKTLLFLLFSVSTFDKNTHGKGAYQRKRARDLGLVSRALATVVLLILQVRDLQQKRQKLLFWLFLADFLALEGVRYAKSPRK